MAEPTVKLYTNIGTEGTPSWSEVTAAKQIVFCSSGGSSGMTSPPEMAIPDAGTALYSEMWMGSSGTYSQLTVYTGDITTFDNQNVLKWTWTSGFAAAPICTCYDNSGRTTSSLFLTGTAGDTNTKSYMKGTLTSAAISTSWASATTGTSGAVSTLNAGQALKGNDYYLSLSNSTWNGASSQTFSLAPYIGANYVPDGSKTVLISLKYYWS